MKTKKKALPKPGKGGRDAKTYSIGDRVSVSGKGKKSGCGK